LDAYSLRGVDYKILKPAQAQGNFTVYELGPDFGTSFLCFNQNRGINPQTGSPFLAPEKLRWFSDLTFRSAVAHAIDKASLIAIVMEGLGFGQESAMSPSAGLFYNGHVPMYPYDLDRAKALLSAGGYKDTDGDGVIEDAQGVPVEFTLVTNAQNTQRVQIANVIRKDLERLGMKVTFTQLEFNTLVSKLNATFDWDAVLLGLTGGIEPHFGRNVWHSSGGLHMWWPNQPSPQTEWEAAIDQIFEQGVQELDPDKRKTLYDRWQVIVAEQLPLIYTVLAPQITAVRNRFGNLRPTAYGGAFHNIEELYVVDR
jgi:peptide/nickel transport system substrate-binding protein